MNTLRTLREISTFAHENTQRTPYKISTSNHKMHHEHSARRRGPIYRTRILTLSNPYFHIIKYTYSFHRKHISVRHFVDIYGYAGTINLPLRLLVGCEQGNEHSVENLRSLTKWVANILLYRLFSIVILFIRC